MSKDLCLFPYTSSVSSFRVSLKVLLGNVEKCDFYLKLSGKDCVASGRDTLPPKEVVGLPRHLLLPPK